MCAVILAIAAEWSVRVIASRGLPRTFDPPIVPAETAGRRRLAASALIGSVPHMDELEFRIGGSDAADHLRAAHWIARNDGGAGSSSNGSPNGERTTPKSAGVLGEGME